jgi:hypothetical protein
VSVRKCDFTLSASVEDEYGDWLPVKAIDVECRLCGKPIDIPNYSRDLADIIAESEAHARLMHPTSVA